MNTPPSSLGDSVIRAIEAESVAQQETIRAIGQQVISALAPVTELPQLVNDQTKRLYDGMADTTRMQILVALAEQNGVVGANESRIRDEMEMVSRIRARLEERVRELREKSVEELARVDTAVRQHVEKLDGPVLALGRGVFRQAIFQPLIEKIAPFWGLLGDLGKRSASRRTDLFAVQAAALLDRLANWDRQADELRRKTAAFRHSPVSRDSHRVPVLLATYETDGRDHRVMWIAPIAADGGGLSDGLTWLSAEVKRTALERWHDVWPCLAEVPAASVLAGSAMEELKAYGATLEQGRKVGP